MVMVSPGKESALGTPGSQLTTSFLRLFILGGHGLEIVPFASLRITSQQLMNVFFLCVCPKVNEQQQQKKLVLNILKNINITDF